MDPYLLNKYLAGDTAPTENGEVYEWIKSSDENEESFRRLRKLQDISIWNDFKSYEEIPPKKSKPRFLKPLLRIAGVLLIGVFLGHIFQRQDIFNKSSRAAGDGEQMGMRRIDVPAGQSVELLLTDGTKVWLNSKSTLIFPEKFNGKERVVKLAGEGYFNVSHNPHYPFKVEAGDCEIKVLGTEFNVRAYEKQRSVEASLLKGSIMLTMKKTEERVQLNPGESIQASDDGNFDRLPFNKEEFLWKEGILFIDNKDIYEIIPVLEQYFDVQINVKNTHLKRQRKYTGKFRIQDGLVHILKVLQMHNDFTLKRDTVNNIIDIQ